MQMLNFPKRPPLIVITNIRNLEKDYWPWSEDASGSRQSKDKYSSIGLDGPSFNLLQKD
jgi:hypothetical protein